MEAVPRLPMICFNLKLSPERTAFGPKLKQYIADAYNEDPESYANEIRQLEALRRSAVPPTIDVTGVQTLKRYFCQLHFLQSRFPMGKGEIAAVTFSWRDIYASMVCSLADIKFELVSILYNIGALHTQLGAFDSRTTSDGMKVTCTHFQCAAWAFQYLRQQYPQPAGVDLAPEVMQFMHQLCLAQAQECILEKSMLDNRKATIIAKVAVQVVDYYNQALNTLNMGGDEGSIAETVGSKIYKEWTKYLKFKIAYHTCISLLYQGQQAEEQQKMGERVAFYHAASQELDNARKLSKGLDKHTAIMDAIAFTMDVVEGKKKAATNENEFIYHEEVPERDTLQLVKGASLVKGIPFNFNDLEVSGPDIFGRLVPMQAHEASSIYSEEKAQLLRKVTAQVEDKDNQLVGYVASLQLETIDQAAQIIINGAKMTDLPQEVVDRAALLNANSDAIQKLVQVMAALANLYHDVESMLDEMQHYFQEEESREQEYQTAVGTRPPSMVSTELKREAGKYREAHTKANESNQTLHRAMTLHVNNLKLLALPLEELRQHIPTLKVPDPNINVDAVKELHKLINKIDEMRKQRVTLLAQLRESITKDDVTEHIVTKPTDQPLDALFEQEMQKHQHIVKLIEQNMIAQDNIMQAMTDAYARHSNTRKTIVDLLKQRETTVHALSSSYDAYEDLLSKANKGIDFYKKLETNVSKLLQRVKSTCKVQSEERETILAKNKPPPPLPPPSIASKTPGVGGTMDSVDVTSSSSGGYKLKDYLASMKRDSSSSSPSAYSYHPPYTPAAPGIPTYDIPPSHDPQQPVVIPSVRPAPVGSEGTNEVMSKVDDKTTYQRTYPTPAMYAPGYEANYYYQQNVDKKSLEDRMASLMSKSNYQYPPSGGSSGAYYGQHPSYPVENYPAQQYYGQDIPTYTSTQTTPTKYSYPAQNAQYPSQPQGIYASTAGGTQQYPMNSTGMGIGAPSASQYQISSTATTVTSQYPSVNSTGGNQYPTNNSYPPGNTTSNTSLQQTYPTSPYKQEVQNPSMNYPTSYPISNQQPGTSQQYPADTVGNQQQYPTNYSTPTVTSTNQTPYPTNYSTVTSANQYSTNYPTAVTSTNHGQYPTNYPTQTVTSANQYSVNYPTAVTSANQGQYPTQYPTVTAANQSQQYPVNYPTSTSANQVQYPSSNSANQTQYPVNYPTTVTSSIQSQYSVSYPQVTSANQAQYPTNYPTTTSANQYSTFPGYYYQQQAYSAVNPPAGNQQQTYYGHPGYGYDPTTGQYLYSSGFQNTNLNDVATGQTIPTNYVGPVDATHYTSAGTYSTTQTPSEQYTPATTDPSTNQTGQSETNYYSPPYGRKGQEMYTTPFVTNSYPSGQPQSPLTYINSSTSNVNNTMAVKSVITSTQDNSSTKRVESNVDLLADIDFNIPYAPLTPQNQYTIIEQQPTSDTNIVVHEKKSEIVRKKDEIKPVVATITTVTVKDPLTDPEILNQFTQEIEKFEKFVENLTNKTLNGPTPLDLKWKELQDLQDKDGLQLNISVARCYPIKNRFPDILPFDYSRVELPSTKDDYINASHVKNITPYTPSFILTQAPLQTTLSDFWTMIWEQQCEIIVCLLNDSELQDVYFPKEKGQDLIFGRFRCSLESSNVKAHSIERTITMCMLETKMTRVIIHLQFISWPGISFPASPGPFLSFVCEVLTFHNHQRSKDHSIVVHCDSGIGRSGLLCLLAAYILQPAPLPDIVKLVARISQNRKQSLRDREHLKFAYQAILYHAQDLLMKRGILTSRSSFEESIKPKTHTRHPSQDLLLGPAQQNIERPNSQASSEYSSKRRDSNISQASITSGRNSPTDLKKGKFIESSKSSDPLCSLDPLWNLRRTEH